MRTSDSKLLQVLDPGTANLDARAYWDKHYNFAVLSKNSPKKITADFFNLIVINTIIPIRFANANFLGRIGEADIFEWFSKVPNERNSILKKSQIIKPQISMQEEIKLYSIFINNTVNRKNVCLAG